MSGNYFSEINLHLVWHTKNSMPLLTPKVEPMAHRYLKQRIMDTPGAFLHAIGGIETHVHLAVTVPPKLTPSEWIGQLKGGSSHDVNEEIGMRNKSLQWQSGYGVVSFGTRDLPWVIDYVLNQRSHHANHRVHHRLESITEMEIPSAID